MLLQGGAKRRTEDGLPAVSNDVGAGFAYSAGDGAVRVTELLPGFRGSRAGLVVGDTIVKVNDTEMTRESIPKLGELLAGEAGTKVRLTVRHSGSERLEVIELTRERFLSDPATGEQLYPLRAAVKERLAKAPRDAGLLELRAELAGQWSDAKAQVADYTAAIEALSQQTREATAVDLKRLYGRRGNAYVSLEKWQEAAADYAHVVTKETTDEELLTGQARAHAVALLPSPKWIVLSPAKMLSQGGATLTKLGDHSILASGTNPDRDVYSLFAKTDLQKITAIRLEALPDPSLPSNGPGRFPGSDGRGNFHLNELRVFSRGQPCPLTNIIVDYDESGEFRNVIDGKLDATQGWSNYPWAGKANTAVIATRSRSRPG